MTASSPRRKSALPRLKKRREFLRVAGKGRKWAAPGLVLQACPRAQAAADANAPKSPLSSEARIGYTVTRKVGNAVVRNRAKRRLRAAARLVMGPHARSGTDFVIIGRAATLNRPFDKLVGDLEAALKKLDCYRD